MQRRNLSSHLMMSRKRTVLELLRQNIPEDEKFYYYTIWKNETIISETENSILHVRLDEMSITKKEIKQESMIDKELQNIYKYIKIKDARRKL